MPAVKRTTAGQTKTGSKADKTDAAHIYSHEVNNAVLSHKRGTNYGEEKYREINKQMNNDQNVRIKTRTGNLYGNDGYSGDRYHDTQIVEAIKTDNKILTNKQTVERVQRQWEQVQQMDLPYKEEIRAQFSQFRDQNGNVIIRKNAALE